MKKILLISLITLNTSVYMMCGAQITLTSTNNPVIGDAFVEANDTTPTVNQGGGGPSQTWNLSAIVNQKKDTGYYVNPSSTPYFSDFPSSNLTSKEIYDGENIYGYLNSSSGSLSTDGIVVWTSSIFDEETSSVPSKDLVYPSTYLTNWDATYRQIEYSSYLGDSIKTVFNTAFYDTIDAWGSVTTPINTYNSLRLVVISKPVNDSEYLYNTTSHTWNFIGATKGGTPSLTYFWYASGLRDAVASVTLDSLGGSNVISATYLISDITSTKNLTVCTNAEVYPNPASNFVTIALKAFDANGYVKINDITGREIQVTPFANGKIQLNTVEFANGVYLYTLIDRNGNLQDKGKFIVIH